MNRRQFLLASAAAPLAAADLQPMTAGIVPITTAEREVRLDKARRLMNLHRINAIVLEGGTSMYYFTGTRWGSSERTFALVIPQRGDLAWVVPAFEEQRAREVIHFGADIRTWEEDESPYQKIAQILKDRGAAAGKAGMEERVRFFLFDGVRKQLPTLELTSADPITAGCRMFKSAAEIALLQRANDVTIAAYKNAIANLKEGMTQFDLRGILTTTYRQLGFQGSSLVSFGKFTAYPHGSIQPQKLQEGDVVQIDDGAVVEGYQADITRTTVFGKPTDRQRQIWDIERKAQDAAFSAARIGASCESVDAAARKVITDAGFGPGYKVPGLPHRTGHGIGLDGHEWPYLVKGNTMKLQAGLCFSDEPMLTIYGEFGIRLEDCFYMTEEGPRFFTKQSPAIDQPFG